ncbi:Cyclin B and related kinase-activating proteins [Phaffia rhodozyma]|uniref:Cyclin B and related kinase-activating proteins n=1 Tax=Phaffia rhodozyma TaxID=264483 RepID=A0A0F7SFR3_PHARH|nr:Cyclin B and related kinase-activating proteins [Phaffia rhodozyma]
MSFSVAIPDSLSGQPCHRAYSNPSRKRSSVVLSPSSSAVRQGSMSCSHNSSSPSSSLSSVTPCPSTLSVENINACNVGPEVSRPARTLPSKAQAGASAVLIDVRRKIGGNKRMSLAKPSTVSSILSAVRKVSTQVVESASFSKANRILFEDEYAAEAVAYMAELEKVTLPKIEIMNQQPELAWYMRPFLVEFLVEIHQQFRLRPEVLYLTINIIDRYVSKRIVFKKHYQLVGCSSLWIAAKYEDSKDKIPSLETLRSMCCDAYDESAFLQMERHVLNTIGWTIGHPSAESWLRYQCMGTTLEDAETQHVARFLMEISLFHKEFIPLLPSSIARGALLLARFLLDKPRMPIDEDDPAVAAAFLIDSQLGRHLEQLSEVLIAKYAPAYYGNASLFVRAQYLKGRRFELLPPPVMSVQQSTIATPEKGPAFSAPKQSPTGSHARCPSGGSNSIASSVSSSSSYNSVSAPASAFESFTPSSSTSSKHALGFYSSDSDIMPDTPTFRSSSSSMMTPAKTDETAPPVVSSDLVRIKSATSVGSLDSVADCVALANTKRSVMGERMRDDKVVESSLW